MGLGIPLLKLAAEQTGGEVSIESRHESEFPSDHGTVVCAVFYKNHIDFTPMGDIVSTMVTLIQGSPDIDFEFTDRTPKGAVELFTVQLKEVLGDISLAEPEIQMWISEYLNEQYSNRNN